MAARSAGRAPAAAAAATGELDQLSQDPFDGGADQPVLAEAVGGDVPELFKLIQPFADRHQPTLYRLSVQPRMAGHRARASS